MNKIIQAADRYLANSNWKMLTLLKFCLCAMGILWGIATPEKYRKPVAFTAIAVFILTYIPLMTSFLPYLTEEVEIEELPY